MSDRDKIVIKNSLELIREYGGIDGAHHKDWVIDQIARKLAGNDYNQFVSDCKKGEDGPDTYGYSCGVAP